MKRPRFGELLLKGGLIDQKQLQEALEECKEFRMRIGEVLIKRGWATEAEICGILSEQLKIPIVSLTKRKVPPEILGLLSPKICSQKKVVPLGFKDKILWVATSNPLDYETLDDIKFIVEHPVKPVIAMEREIMDFLLRFHPFEDGPQFFNEYNADKVQVQVVENIRAKEEIDFEHLKKVAKGGVIRQLTNGIITNAISKNASDIHIEPQEGESVVRYRIDGIMKDVMTFTKSAHPPVVSRVKIMAELDITIRRTPQDGRARIIVEKQPYDLRISSLPTFYGEKLVIRIQETQESKQLTDLAIDEDVLSQLIDCLKRPQGLILVTGPTGSGKTSTLYAALNYILSPDINIITIEDPIEYSLAGINQVQVNSRSGMTFAKGLRSILRQDPDVVMVGEIRDKETADIALQAAQTGHLVLSTLHTNDAAKAVLRLADMGIDPFIISSSLLCVIGQRLVRQIHKKCSIDHEPPAQILKKFPDVPPGTFKKGGGCPECDGTGFKGRLGIFELLLMSEGIGRLISEQVPEWKIIELARKEGMVSMAEDGFKKARQGLTTIEEIVRIVPISEVTFEDNAYAAPMEEQGQDLSAQIHQRPDGIRKDRIMIIDDDEDIRRLVTKIIEDEFYEVLAAKDGFEGLNMIFEKTPDLILLDNLMPRMSGIQFIEKIKAHSRIANIPIIMLTATEAEETEVQALNTGADDWIGKPINKLRLLARIKRFFKEDQRLRP